ncbi:hypothetical protein TNCV_2201831 [Trichonephila clavipes]|uniref:Uncharacterized protein n=1 Tax=Trichonephila clavipes TaxID=2585209 RepID=A0A8X6UR85_TRICX|nr:hypothetical protein TNCV_2201831 [Trichonephila clavipes]
MSTRGHGGKVPSRKPKVAGPIPAEGVGRQCRTQIVDPTVVGLLHCEIHSDVLQNQHVITPFSHIQPTTSSENWVNDFSPIHCWTPQDIVNEILNNSRRSTIMHTSRKENLKAGKSVVAQIPHIGVV